MISQRTRVRVRRTWFALLWLVCTFGVLSLLVVVGYTTVRTSGNTSAAWSVDFGFGALAIYSQQRGAPPEVLARDEPLPSPGWRLYLAPTLPFDQKCLPLPARHSYRGSHYSTTGNGPIAVSIDGLQIPLWLIIAVLLLMFGPVWWLTRPAPAGHCPACRYSLTGNTSGVCPQCGRLRTERDSHISEPWLRQAARVLLAYGLLALVTAPLALWTCSHVFALAPVSWLDTVAAIALGHLVLAPLLVPAAAYGSKALAGWAVRVAVPARVPPAL